MMELEKRDILIIISLFLVAFLIRAAGVSNPNIFIFRDEIRYWFRAIRILSSNFVPSAEILPGYPSPFLPYIMAMVTSLFGGDLNNLRMISVIFGSLTVPFLYLFGKAIYDRKTGLLAASFMCFSAYHCLFSRTIMLEAFTIFFVTVFLYFFWLSQRSDDRKSIIYACIAGAMMGLAIAAKYLPIFLIFVVFAYSLWTKRFNFKALMDKKIILTLIFAMLFFSPIPIWWYYTGMGLDPVYHATIEKFGVKFQMMDLPPTYTQVVELPLGDLFISSVEKITEMLSWGAKILIPPWTVLFELSAILLLLITLFSYLPNFINKENEGSFLIILILSLCIFLSAFQPSRYYLMYSFPTYFVMLSHLVVKSFEHLGNKREKSFERIFRIFIISLAVIMLSFSLFIAVISPYCDEGDSSWIKNSVDYIKSDVTKSGYEGNNILIGCAAPEENINYYIHLSGFNATVVPIRKPAGSKYEVTIEFKNINTLKPDYIIMSESQYDYLFRKTHQAKIFEDYRTVFHHKSYYFSGGFVLKRKNMHPQGLLLQKNELLQKDDIDGKISQDIFNRSVPDVMEVGKTYTALVKVKNTGDSSANFIIRVHSEKFIIFVEDKPAWRDITLDKGSTRILKFKMVPIREYVGELPITVDLYAKHKENETYRKVDSSTDYVYLIKR